MKDNKDYLDVLIKIQKTRSKIKEILLKYQGLVWENLITF